MFYVVYGILYLFSLLPFWFFYFLSDGISFLLNHVFKYRKDVVLYNLSIAFPEKTIQERKEIATKFYRNFTDSFLETIKLISISKKQLDKRFTANYEVINELHGNVKQLQILLGHFFNWEYGNCAYASNVKYPLLIVYMPIKNKIINKLFMHIRERFDAKMISATNYRNEFGVYQNKEYLLGLVADQNPGAPDKSYWTDFFGKKAPFVKGPERGGKINNTGILMCNIYKKKRGYYGSEIQILTLFPKDMAAGEITKKMVQFIEDSLRKDPANYLWSHRRFRFEYNEKEHAHLVI